MGLNSEQAQSLLTDPRYQTLDGLSDLLRQLSIETPADKAGYRLYGLRSLKKLMRLACLFALHQLVVGCSDSQNPNAVNEIELRNGDAHAKFVMPAKYKVKKPSDTLMIFRCKYPGMQPLDPNGIPQDDDINVFITLLEDRPGRTENFVMEALDHFDPVYPHRNYRGGRQGDYELFRQTIGRGKAQTEVITYVFNAKDGALVGVEDPGSWSRNFEVDRKIGNDLHVHYLISKPIGQDFIKIDETVIAFILSHIR